MACINDTYTLKCTIGTTFQQDIKFYDDLTAYTALFVIRENISATPVISKEFTMTDNGDGTFNLAIELTPSETELLSVPTSKSYGSYRWGLDFGTSDNSIRIPAMPQTGNEAPYFLAFNHWANGDI